MRTTTPSKAASIACTAFVAAIAAGCAAPRGLAPKSSIDDVEDLRVAETLAAAPSDPAPSDLTLSDPAPTDAAPGGARPSAAARTAAADWPSADWWTAFGDPQLDRLVSEGLAGSPSLAVARARVEKAAALAGVARSALLPRLDASATSARQRFSEGDVVPPPNAGNWMTESRLALEFGYAFDVGGGRRAALAARGRLADAARVDRFATRLLLSVSIARAYVELARLYDRLDIATATLAQRQQIFDLTRRRVDAGLDTRVALKEAEAALPATREEIAQIEEALELTRHEIAALLGAGPDRGLAIERPKLGAGDGDLALPSRLPAELLARRPDVAAGRLRVEAAAHDIDAAKAAFLPNVNLAAFAGFASLSQLIEAGSRIAGVGPAVGLPLFEGGRLRSRLASADADYDLAVEQYNQTLVEALRDIADRLASIRSVKIQGDEQRAALAAAQEAYDLARARYREGVGDYLSVLSAETQVLEQRRLAADLRARGFDNRIGLVRALGGGFEPTRVAGGARADSRASAATESSTWRKSS